MIELLNIAIKSAKKPWKFKALSEVSKLFQFYLFWSWSADVKREYPTLEKPHDLCAGTRSENKETLFDQQNKKEHRDTFAREINLLNTYNEMCIFKGFLHRHQKTTMVLEHCLSKNMFQRECKILAFLTLRPQTFDKRASLYSASFFTSCVSHGSSLYKAVSCWMKHWWFIHPNRTNRQTLFFTSIREVKQGIFRSPIAQNARDRFTRGQASLFFKLEENGYNILWR